MKIPQIKPLWAVIVLLAFALCAGRIYAQTGAYTELDEDGWSVFTLRPEGRIFYVSNAGSDGNNGLSPETPFKTIQWAMFRMKGGDWLLLKRGEVFNQAINGSLKNGPSPQHKTVFGAYGDPADPRPILDPPGPNSQVMAYHSGDTNGMPIVNIALVDLHLYQSERDPSSPNYIPNPTAEQNGNTAIQLFPNGEELLFENLLIEFFASGITLQGDVNRSEGGYHGIHKVTLRRCTIANSYSTVIGYHSSGIFFDGVFDFRIEENFFDHNGHYPNITNANPTIFNHNMYIQSSCGPNNMIRHNIIARASSHGIQLRPGGSVMENLFINNGIAGFVADNLITNPATEVMVLNNNVVLEGAPWGMRDENGLSGGRGWGLLLEGSSGRPTPNVVQMRNNIVANGGLSSAYQTASKFRSVADTSGNITYNWGSVPNTPGSFPNPGRTSGSYNAALGGTGTMAAYLAAVKGQNKGNWNPLYTWEPIYDYIRAGFGIAGPGGTSATRVVVLPESAAMEIEETLQLAATVLPIDAAEREVVWSSSNLNVATVSSEGLITAVAGGTATITATSVDGSHTDTCIVTVGSIPQPFWPVVGASVEDAESETYFSAWFGHFKEQESWNGMWIQHQGLGWLYTGVAVTEENIWIWSPHIQSWIYVAEAYFPWVWVHEDGWMYFAHPDSAESGWLYSYATENWMQVIP